MVRVRDKATRGGNANTTSWAIASRQCLLQNRRADDDRVVRIWAAYVSYRNAIGWQADFASRRVSLDEKDLRRFWNTIAELEEHAACVPARKPAAEDEVKR